MQNDEDRQKRRKGVKPTMLDQSYYETANEIISRYPLEEKSLIPIIQDIQATYRYLPPDLLDYVAKKIGITETKAYSVASFYENFSFEQKGKYVLKICDGTACHVRKSTPVLHQLADADLIGGALGGGIVRAGRGIVRAGGGCLRLGAAAGGKGQRHGRSQNKSEQFLFHSDLLLLSVSGRIHKVGCFPKNKGGALSVEQSPLAFNECKPYARQNACSVSAL